MKAIGYLWMALLVVYIVIAAIIGTVLHIFLGAIMWLPAALLLIVVVIATIVIAATVIPENHEGNLEVFGEYEETLEAGLHFIFPFFGIMKIKDNRLFFMGEDITYLFDGPYKDIPLEKRDAVVKIDLKGDASVYLEANAFVQVVDSYKAAYAVKDVFKSIRTKLEGAVITFFGDKTLDAANANKSSYNLVEILGQDMIDYIFDTWGVRIIKLAIDDFKLSEADLAVRREYFAAENNFKKSKLEAKAKIIMADANFKELQLNGKGFAAQVDSLVDSGLSREEAIEYLGFVHKWSEIGKNDKAVIIDDSQGFAGAGVKFGQGFNMNQKI